MNGNLQTFLWYFTIQTTFTTAQKLSLCRCTYGGHATAEMLNSQSGGENEDEENSIKNKLTFIYSIL